MTFVGNVQVAGTLRTTNINGGVLTSNSFGTFSGSFPVTSTGNYPIPLPFNNNNNTNFAGKLACTINNIAFGIWVGQADVTGQFSNTLRPSITNISSYNFTGTGGPAIAANITPYLGVNSGAYDSSGSQQLAQVAVTTLAASSTLKYTFTNFLQN